MPDDSASKQSKSRFVGRLGLLMVAAFVETLGNFLILALLPFYAERYGATPLEIGALIAAFAVAQTLTAPFWGRFSDRAGRRPVILLGLVLATLAYVLFAFADSLWLLLLSRLAQGIAGGTVPVVFAYTSDVPRAGTPGGRSGLADFGYQPGGHGGPGDRIAGCSVCR